MLEEPPTPGQLRIKAATAVTTVFALGILLLHDWGPNNVFSGIRPALKSYFNRIYGVTPNQQGETAEKDHSSS